MKFLCFKRTYHIKNYISAYFYPNFWMFGVIDIIDEPLHRLRQPTLRLVFYGCYRVYCPISFELVYGQFLPQVFEVHGRHVPFVGQH